MYKKICTFLLLLFVSFTFVGCGELSFEDTPYTESDKTNAEIISFYDEAHVGNLELNAKYEGTITQKYGTTTKVNKVTYIIGTYGSGSKSNYCNVENQEIINDVVIKTVTDIYYKDWRYTTTHDTATDTTTKVKTPFFTENINRDLILTIFPRLYEESIELSGHKQYNNEHYYRISLTKQSVNDEFTNPVIIRPEDTYIYNFAYEFGVNSGGYLAYIVNDYTLIDANSYNADDKTYTPILTYSSIFKLVPPYGSTMFMPEPPNEAQAGEYEEI